MSLTLPPRSRPMTRSVCVTSLEMLSADGFMMTKASSQTSQNYIAANMAMFVPFHIQEATTILQLWNQNGSAAAGNLDMGIFGEDGTLIVSKGTTAQSGTSAIQYFDIADTSLNGPARYYLGITSDTSGATQKIIAFAPPAILAQACGCLQMSAAPPFSTNANPAVFAAYAQAQIPYIGFTIRNPA